jgi:hypothetical protein
MSRVLTTVDPCYYSDAFVLCHGIDGFALTFIPKVRTRDEQAGGLVDQWVQHCSLGRLAVFLGRFVGQFRDGGDAFESFVRSQAGLMKRLIRFLLKFQLFCTWGARLGFVGKQKNVKVGKPVEGRNVLDAYLAMQPWLALLKSSRLT